MAVEPTKQHLWGPGEEGGDTTGGFHLIWRPFMRVSSSDQRVATEHDPSVRIYNHLYIFIDDFPVQNGDVP